MKNCAWFVRATYAGTLPAGPQGPDGLAAARTVRRVNEAGAAGGEGMVFVISFDQALCRPLEA